MQKFFRSLTNFVFSACIVSIPVLASTPNRSGISRAGGIICWCPLISENIVNLERLQELPYNLNTKYILNPTKSSFMGFSNLELFAYYMELP